MMNRIHPLKKFYDVIDFGEPIEKMNRLPDFPRIIEMELTNHCNFQCIMCKTGTNQAQRARGYMTAEVFDKIIEELTGHNVAIKFVGQGEPTLHPKFIDFVKKAKEKGIVCHLTTNGSMLTDKYMEEIIESGLDSIKFSFQGVNSAGYEMLRRKNDFEILLEKIEKLYTKRKTNLFPFITIGTSILNETEAEIEEFKKRCSGICDKLEIGVTTLEFIDLDKVQGLKQKEELEVMKHSQEKHFKRYKCCHQVFDVITVHWNGNICACCADNDEVMLLGNISNTSINECWNSDKEKAYRSVLAEKKYEALPLCKDCYDVYGWTYNQNN